jgi:TetR/AcrR family transcriptional regulator, regulator of cefoperazone and chloramphenicol sensitivity
LAGFFRSLPFSYGRALPLQNKLVQLIETYVLNTCMSFPVMADKDIDTTRDRIVEAAGQIFAERGFEATTVRDICHAAGANIAAVNYYFGDKQRLYIEAVLRANRWRMEHAALPDWSANTPPEKKLADFIATFIRRVRTGPKDAWQNRLMMREMMRPDAACAEVVRESIRPQFEVLLGILRAMLPADTAEDELHLTAFSIVGQCLFYHFADPVVRHLIDDSEYAEYSIERLAAHIAKFSVAGLKLPALSSTSRAQR